LAGEVDLASPSLRLVQRPAKRRGRGKNGKRKKKIKNEKKLNWQKKKLGLN